MSKPSTSIIHHLRMMAGAYREDARSDAELIERYAATRDDAAFATLTVRHGPLVWSICRRILGNTQDAEDAYQIAFLALANKAGRIHVTETAAGWLHQVALRTALDARETDEARRRRHKRLQAVAKRNMPPEVDQDESYEILHNELVKLPENLRLPIVLHYLEGKTRVEAADILGVTESAVRKRMARGQALLEKRLRKHGLTAGVVTLGTLLESASSHGAPMPAGLAAKTMQTAVNFHEGRLTGGAAELARGMLNQASADTPWWMKGWLIALACVGGLGLGAGGVAWRAGFFNADAGGKVDAPAQTTSRTKMPQRLDAYGDPLPEGALARLGTTRLRLTDAMSFLVFTADGKGLVTTGAGSAARLCDVATGKLLREYGRDVRTVALSRDGRILAGRDLCRGDFLCAWDFSTGKLLQEIKLRDPKLPAALAISPDGKTVALSDFHKQTVRLWEIAAGRLLWEKPTSSYVFYLCYALDGKTLLGSDQDELHLWNADTGEELDHWSGKRSKNRDGQAEASISWCFYAPAARSAAVAYNHRNWTRKGVTHLWNVETKKEVRRFEDPEGAISGIALSDDGKVLATCNFSGMIHLWSAATGQELRRCKGGLGWGVCGAAFSPDGKVLASRHFHHDNTVRLWDAESGREITPQFDGHRSWIMSVAFTRDGKKIISGGNDGVFREWDPSTGLGRLPAGQAEHGYAYMLFIPPIISPDGKKIAYLNEIVRSKDEAAGTAFYLNNEKRLSARIRDRSEDRNNITLPSLRSRWKGTKELIFSSDGARVAWIEFTDDHECRDGKVHLWDATTGKEMYCFSGNAAAFSAAGKILAVGTKKEQGMIGLWDVEKGSQVGTIRTGSSWDDVESLAFSPDDLLLAIGCGDGKVRLCSLALADGTVVRVGSPCKIIDCPKRPSDWIWPAGFAAPLLFSPDGRTLAVSDHNCISLWEAASGKERRRFEGHADRILCLAFAPDGRRLASGGQDTTVLVWDVTGWQTQKDFPGAKLSNKSMESLWGDLRGGDCRRAGRAVWTLAAAGSPAVSFLAKRLPPTAASKESVEQLVADLDADAFAVRCQARQKLAALGEFVVLRLERALRDKRPSLEQRLALQQLLEQLDAGRFIGTGEELRCLRAIEVLEHIGTREARQALQKLTAGTPAAFRTRAAQQALDYLERERRRQKT